VKERNHLGDVRRWEDNVRITLRKYSVRMWSGLIWLRIRTSGELLWT